MNKRTARVLLLLVTGWMLSLPIGTIVMPRDRKGLLHISSEYLHSPTVFLEST